MPATQCTDSLVCYLPQISCLIGIFNLILWGVTAYVTFGTRRSDHEWRRRQYALDIIAMWPARVSDHLKVLEEQYPNIRQDDKIQISYQEAEAIYKTQPNDPNRDNKIKVRFALISFLNFLEFIALAYRNNVADQAIIETGLQRTMIKWYLKLNDFTQAVTKIEGHNPWQPLDDLIRTWNAPNVTERQRTG